jgi:ferredoxin
MKSFYLLLCFNQVDGFSIISKSFKYGIIYDNISSSTLYSDNNGYSNDEDSNRWISLDDSFDPDWESKLQKRQDGSLWSSFLPSKDDVFEEGIKGSSSISSSIDGLDDGEAWLDALASVAAEEINFIVEEADRADKLLQMQEWGFEPDTIRNTLNLAVDESLEIDEDNEVFEKFKKETAKTGFSMYLNDDEDLTTVESHTTVDVDEETGEPIRTQMVYVDEHTCIGCTHCAGVAQSTFFMEPYLGRARVFQQWGDDDETIQIAIETCPVDCIHYVPYDELVSLEIDRRDQNINFKARLVNQGEYGGGTSQNVGGSVTFTGPQKISGNMGSRCNNCPSRGCADCPMYGVGKNPYFEAKEKARKEKLARKKLKAKMEEANRSADL